MATRTAFPGTQSAGQVLTSANFTKLPGGWIGYVEKTTDQLAITTLTAVTSLSVTVTVNASRRVLVSAYLPRVQQNSVTGTCKMIIQESGVSLVACYNDALTVGEDLHMNAGVVLTPSTGSHTYALVAGTGAGNMDVYASADGDPGPAYLLVQDIGPAA